MNMRVLVLGGCGFIGRHVVSSLSSDGIESVVFDMNADSDCSSAISTFVKGSFTDANQLETVIRQSSISHIIHLISTTLPKSSNDDMKYDIKSNVIGTLSLLELCVKYKIKKILFMSSGGTIYGPPKSVPVSETHATEPICSYGISKLAIEKYLGLYKHLHGLNYVVLRAANPYGPGQNPFSGQGVIANFVHRIHCGLQVEIWGNGSIIRDYFDVRDLAKLAKLALLASGGGIYNAGSGLGVSINNLLALVARKCNVTPTVLYKDQRKLDVPTVILNCEAAKRKFGWHATISLQDGISDYIAWYQATFNQAQIR